MEIHAFRCLIFMMMEHLSQKLAMELVTVALVHHQLLVILATQAKTENLSQNPVSLCLGTMKTETMWLQNATQTVWNASQLRPPVRLVLLESFYQVRNAFLAYGHALLALMLLYAKLV